ncbi:glycosyltransferase family 4 protein [Methanocella arvoryzae]|uniref:Glycosyltransferase (Group 1) n=1 Tax=Methanocella arvoryzae (strain DSM 22066 / NBRC 105507 / MRE50) TaxID=351160 RepID=Q0W317_METAR|nr:glycosyltransferase family 4 protein [Methanocella arvoryzae]CAJ37226.1 putative glycosyltransferase (group 1) [Methanocella arvoryzae MRE50]
MKISVMHWAFPPVVGGVESHLVYLYEELARRGHEISLLTAPHPERDDSSYDWIRITSDEYMSLEYLQKKAPVSGRYEKVYDMMERFILKENPEVIHAHNFHYFIPDHAECLDELAKKYGIPIVLTIHNYWEDDLCKHLMRDIKWDKIVAVSYFMKSPCIFHSMLPQDKVEVHYHGVDLNKYCVPTDKDAAKARFGLAGRKVIFHPARACKSKGTLHSIEAVSRLIEKYPDICLIVSGNGDSVDFENERPAFRTCINSMISDLKVGDNMLFVAASGEEMPLYMQAADVILYPTITPQGEAFGIAPVEGMACGKPVIVTRSGGLVESTQHSINGIVLDVSESLSEELARHIDHLLSNPDHAEYLGNNGRELALERFDSKKMALKMEDLYNRLVNASIVEKVDRMDTVIKPGAGNKGLGTDFAGQSRI